MATHLALNRCFCSIALITSLRVPFSVRYKRSIDFRLSSQAESWGADTGLQGEKLDSRLSGKSPGCT